MKFLTLLFITNVAFAGSMWFPAGKEAAVSFYVEKATCEKNEGQECYDTEACPLDRCDLVDEVLEGEDHWSNPFNLVQCNSEDHCKEMLPTLCDSGKKPFYRENVEVPGTFEAFCAFKLAPELTGKKILQVNFVKLAALEIKEKDEKLKAKADQENKQLIREKLKEFKKSDLKTVADIREFLGDLVELLK